LIRDYLAAHGVDYTTRPAVPTGGKTAGKVGRDR
jgi:hypothetical protein